jgi:hypothetical protein
MSIISKERYETYRKTNGVRPARQSSLAIFLGDTNPFAQYGFLGHDHATLFTKDGKLYSYVVQFYKRPNIQDYIDDIKRFCQLHNLCFQVLPEGSEWYNQGRTCCVEIKHDPAYADQMLPYAEITKRNRAQVIKERRKWR